jgi:hypothetical protein
MGAVVRAFTQKDKQNGEGSGDYEKANTNM